MDAEASGVSTKSMEIEPRHTQFRQRLSLIQDLETAQATSLQIGPDATTSDLEEHKDNDGLIYKTALQEGREVYAA